MGKLGFVNICHPDYINEASVGMGKTAVKTLKAAGIDLVVWEDVVSDHKMAHAAARKFIEEDVDGAIVFYGAFVLCSTVMEFIEELEKPLCVWASPMIVRNGLLTTTGSYVAYSMFNGTLERMNIQHYNVILPPDDENAANEIADFAAAAGCAHRLRHTRMGLVGYTSMSIYPGTFDHVMMRHFIGPEVEHFDSYTLINIAEKVTDADCKKVYDMYGKVACFPKNAPAVMVERAAKLYLALKRLCAENDLDAITVKCQYEFSKEYGMVPCVPLSLLADNGIVTSCEGDIPCLVSTVMLNYLTGETVSYGDAIHHDGNVLKLSPCGFMPFSAGNPGIKEIRVSDYPGFSGLMCKFVMRPGKVTMLRLIEDIGDYHLLSFTGEALADSKLRGGDMPSVDVELSGDMKELMREHAGQHYAIAYGDHERKLEILADILDIESVTV